MLEAMLPLDSGDVVCGQYAGYRDEPDVARDSRVETYAALRLDIDPPRYRSAVPDPRWQAHGGDGDRGHGAPAHLDASRCSMLHPAKPTTSVFALDPIA